VEILEYEPNSIVIKTIIRKSNGSVSAVSFDTGEVLGERIARFDTYIQVVEGEAEIMIEDQVHTLRVGSSIIIPAKARNTIKANVRFKMISTIIKGTVPVITATKETIPNE
jgi:quercetin dioxygenase-like cupin family protein